MPDALSACPKCHSEYTYELGALLACPECAHAWSPADAAADDDIEGKVDGFGPMQLKSSVVKKV